MNPDVFGYLATTLNIVMLMPQVSRTWRLRQTKDLSLTTLVIFFISSVLWLLYGVMKPAMPVFISNVVVGAMNLILIIFKLKYK